MLDVFQLLTSISSSDVQFANIQYTDLTLDVFQFATGTVVIFEHLWNIFAISSIFDVFQSLTLPIDVIIIFPTLLWPINIPLIFLTLETSHEERSKLSSDLVVVKKATNRTAEYYLGYFSLFILELFVFSFTEWVDILVMLLLLFVLGNGIWKIQFTFPANS